MRWRGRSTSPSWRTPRPGTRCNTRCSRGIDRPELRQYPAFFPILPKKHTEELDEFRNNPAGYQELPMQLAKPQEFDPNDPNGPLAKLHNSTAACAGQATTSVPYYQLPDGRLVWLNEENSRGTASSSIQSRGSRTRLRRPPVPSRRRRRIPSATRPARPRPGRPWKVPVRRRSQTRTSADRRRLAAVNRVEATMAPAHRAGGLLAIPSRRSLRSRPMAAQACADP